MKKYIFLLLVLGFAYACQQEEPFTQQPLDGVSPGQVSDVKVKNTPGGAIITYKLPQDEDLLYIKAIYQLKDGLQCEAKSSLYKDTIRVEGFSDMAEHDVKLIAVDRSRNESAEMITKIKPLEAPVVTIGKTLKLSEDFGGVRASWDNPLRAEIAVVVMSEDNNKEFIPLETFRNTMVKGDGSIRGMEATPKKLGYYVRDRWGNQSEIKYATLTPLYEAMLDRLKFRQVILPNDMPSLGSDPIYKAFDGDYSMYNYYHTIWGTGIKPSSFTMDLGISCKLSRFKVFQRMQFPYGLGNLKYFEVWGSETLNPSGSWDGWTLLADYSSVKPSGLPGTQYTGEDYEFAAAGENFTIPLASPKVRYLRFKVKDLWGGGDCWMICELEFYGDNR